MEMKIDSDAMNQIVAKAIFDSFDDTAKSELVTKAIENLMNAPANPGDYRDRRTVIQRIFDNAVTIAADKIVREMIEAEFKDRILGLARTALDKAFADTERMDRIVAEVANAIGSGLTKNY